MLSPSCLVSMAALSRPGNQAGKGRKFKYVKGKGLKGTVTVVQGACPLVVADTNFKNTKKTAPLNPSPLQGTGPKNNPA